MTLAKVIRAWRYYHELSIRDAAKEIGIDRSALHRLENGRPVNQATLLRVLGWFIG